MITSVMSTFITALPSGLAERRAQASIRPQLPSLGARAWYEASISADLRARRAYPIAHSPPGLGCVCATDVIRGRLMQLRYIMMNGQCPEVCRSEDASAIQPLCHQLVDLAR